MANFDNECSDLEIKSLFEKSEQPLSEIIDHQKTMQEDVYGYDFKSMSLKDLVEYWHMNNHALTDEKLETLDALGGIKNGYGEKFWMGNFPMHDTKFSNLSQDDQLEAKFEIIDQIHFLANKVVSALIPSHLIVLELKTMKHAIERQKEELTLDYVKPELLSLSDLKQIWFKNLAKSLTHQHNSLNLLGGDLDSAVWKPWKKQNAETSKLHVNDLSGYQKNKLVKSLSLEFECAFELWASIGCDASELYDMYFAKANENVSRQNNGY